MRYKGFTLIEMMVVVVIVGLLAAIAIPQYFKYVAKARQTEVFVNLSSLHTAQQAHFAQHGKYTNILWGENGLGWRPEGYQGGGKGEKFYYTYGFSFSGAQEGVHYFTGKLGAAPEQLGETFADQDKFLAKAAGNIAKKDKIDVWLVDENRNIKNVISGID